MNAHLKTVLTFLGFVGFGLLVATYPKVVMGLAALLGCVGLYAMVYSMYAEDGVIDPYCYL